MYNFYDKFKLSIDSYTNSGFGVDEYHNKKEFKKIEDVYELFDKKITKLLDLEVNKYVGNIPFDYAKPNLPILQIIFDQPNVKSAFDSILVEI